MGQIIKFSNLIILVLTEIVLAGTVYGDVKEIEKPAKAEKNAITDKNIVAIVNNQKITRQELIVRSEEHTSELQSLAYLVCRLLL